MEKTFELTDPEDVASRPRVGCYSQGRTPQLVWASWTGHSWTGTSYSHETGSRPTGFSYVYKYLLVPSRIDGNKQCFHNQYMHTCLLRATEERGVALRRPIAVRREEHEIYTATAAYGWRRRRRKVT